MMSRKNKTEGVQALQLPCESKRPPRQPNCRQTSGDLAERAPIAALATRKRGAPTRPTCRQSPADLPGNAPNAAPAKQNGTEVLQLLQRKGKRRPGVLPRKMTLRCYTCCTCHAKAGGAQVTQFVARLLQTYLEVLQVLHLPQTMRLRCSRCCACQQKTLRRSKCSSCHAKGGGAQAIQLSPDFR